MFIRFRFHKDKRIVQLETLQRVGRGRVQLGDLAAKGTVMILDMNTPKRMSFKLHEIVPLNKNELWEVFAIGHEGFMPTLDLVEVV